MCVRDCGLGDVYKITCNVNNKIYIGKGSHWHKRGEIVTDQAMGYMGRYKDHCKKARNMTEEQVTNPHKTKKSEFWLDIRKYGPDAFIPECLGTYPLDQLNDEEVKAITEYDAINKGYNIQKGGRNYGRKEKLVGTEISAKRIANWKDLTYQANRVLIKQKKRELGLPPFIHPKYAQGKSRKLNIVVGYEVIMQYDGKEHKRLVGSGKYKHLTLEQRLEEAKKQCAELYQELFDRPIEALFLEMARIDSKNH